MPKRGASLQFCPIETACYATTPLDAITVDDQLEVARPQSLARSDAYQAWRGNDMAIGAHCFHRYARVPVPRELVE